jgi:hypothetical protein
MALPATPVFSLVVFFVFFISLAVWLVLANKKRMEEISQLPLEETQKDFASFNQAQNYETNKRN